MPFMTVNGARLCYATIGTGPRVIVFIHGGNGGLSSSLSASGELPAHGPGFNELCGGGGGGGSG